MEFEKVAQADRGWKLQLFILSPSLYLC